MSAPRQILPGITYLVTRRCTHRQFWLRPSEEINQIFLYCLAYAADKSGVKVHAVVVMSNHYHAVVTDPDARLPKFAELLNKYTAKCLNVLHDRGESLWATCQAPSYVRLESDHDVAAKLVYAITNPVAAGLVSHAEHWPGVLLWKPGVHTIERPAILFRKKGPMPESVELTLEEADSQETADQPAVGQHTLEKLVSSREAEIRQDFARAKRRFLGAKAVLAQDPSSSPATEEEGGKLSPRLAAHDKWRRIERLQQLGGFRAAYKDALARWVNKERDVVFPAGTYAMRLFHSVTCAEPAP